MRIYEAQAEEGLPFLMNDVADGPCDATVLRSGVADVLVFAAPETSSYLARSLDWPALPPYPHPDPQVPKEGRGGEDH